MSATEVEATARAQAYAREADLGAAVDALRQRREEILARWLEVVARQPFHRAHPEQAVADHIPALFDAVLATLARAAPVWLEPEAPLDDPAVAWAAEQHAAARAAQGLRPNDVIAEFRLLRQEIWHALREQVPDHAPTGDVIAAQLLLNDAIDGAMGVGLAYFVGALEAAKDEFLLTATHDLRTPLTSLKGTAQYLSRLAARPEPDLAPIRQGLERIDQQSTRLAALISEMLDDTRMRLGRFDLVHEPTHLPTVARRVIERVDPEVGARLRLHVDPAADRTGLWDAARLEAVLENLLSNAVKFSPPGSPIDVSIEGTSDALIVTVADRGRGLEGEELTRLFERFYRSPEVAQAAPDGNGLGLYIARGIVEAHGGQITAASDGRDQGTTLRFTLPWEPSGQAAGIEK
jgi:signal transduction histidine kinase